jgi:hypothetical protein
MTFFYQIHAKTNLNIEAFFGLDTSCKSTTLPILHQKQANCQEQFDV